MLGKGFSSKVYKASHLNNSDEKYAIKVINLKKFKASNHAMLES
jgi:serine/threonine protein kinase